VAYNIIERGVELEILPQAIAEDIAITVYRPLCQGLLTGKYRWGQPLPDDSRGQTSAQIITWLSQHGASVDRFIRFAEQRNMSPVQLAIAWVRYSPAVTSPIIGVSSLAQLQTSIDAFQFDLSSQDYTELTYIFNTEVKEEGAQRFPGLRYNFPALRRDLNLLGE
jgi:aryl-alcohol dehydrogenase-like predicted oxidoreductase